MEMGVLGHGYVVFCTAEQCGVCGAQGNEGVALAGCINIKATSRFQDSDVFVDNHWHSKNEYECNEECA